LTGNKGQIDYSGWIRRIDLRLRAKYPSIKTRIFKIEFRKYCIFIENQGLDFEVLRKDFDRTIRYITAPVFLTNMIPEHYAEELPAISDDHIPNSFEGLYLTLFDMANLIESKYPEVSVSDIKTIRPHMVEVRLQGHVDEKTKEAISLLLSDTKFPGHAVIDDGGGEGSIVAPSNPVFYIPSARSVSRLDLPFLKRDEELWFDHLNAIYAGDFQKKDLFFFDAADTACFVDFSVFDNINLRNHLLLYDVVFCALPPREQMAKFLANQKIMRDEIVYLASRGRLKIINIQPELKLDSKLLRDVYEAHKFAVISRRAVAALCAVDIVSINQNYIFNHPDLYPLTLPLAEALSELGRQDISNVLNFIMWPKNALRSSFEALQQASSKAVSNFGVNNLILQTVSHKLADRYEFEFTMCAESIHVAHALDATYFPTKDDATGFTDLPYALMMGNALNFYKSATGATVDELLKIEQNKAVGNSLIDPISVFEIRSGCKTSDGM